MPGIVWARVQDAAAPKVTLAMINEALKLSGVEVSEDEKTGLVDGANRNLTATTICGSSTFRRTSRRRSTSAR